jgi:hypothetical protein
MKFKHILLVFVVAFLLVGCKSNNISSISYEKFKERVDKKESMILFFGESDTLETTLNNVLNKHNIKAYRVKTSSLDDEEINSLREIIDYDDPSICFIIEGVNPTVLTNITDEYTTEAKLENFLKDLNFIK